MLLHNIFKYDVRPSIALQLFDTFVGSVLTYDCPVWGFTKSKGIERVILRVQIQLCKYVLRVKQATPTTAVYGELGGFQLYIKRLTAIVKYWLKLTKTDHISLQTLFKSMIEDDENGTKHWVTNVKQTLNEYGFNAVKHQELLNHKQVVVLFKPRLNDCLNQKWRADIESNQVLNTMYKHNIDFYLENIVSRKSRIMLTKSFLISSKN